MTQVSGWAHNGDVRLRWVRNVGTDAAEPLLLINGLSSPLVSYEEGFVDELLARRFDVVRFDNRDAGRSSATEGGYQLADMADDAIAVMDTVGWDTAHVFGMSMGGMIVQQLGIDHPDRMKSLTSLMSTTGNQQYGTPSRAAMDALMTPSPDDREGWLAARLASEVIWASPAEYTPEATLAKGELLYDYGVQPRQVIHQYKAVTQSGNRENELAKVAVPTLVLHGSADTLIHPSGGRRTADVMPNATYVELEGMGHDLPRVYWSRIAEHVCTFVDQLT